MSSDWEADFERLLTTVMDGRASSSDLLQLDNLLSESPAALDAYVALIKVDALLRWRSGVGQGSSVVALLDSPPASRMPVLGFFGDAYHGTVGFFSQEVPFAILMATLFMAVGGLIGSVMTVEHYTQMPGQSQPSADRSFASNASADNTIQSEEEVKWVGRITGMVDCKWSADKNFRPPGGDYVSQGRKYKLDSGLMEITYYTGAKVILQGPVAYEVESANGGHLSAGKLTGKVETEKAKGFFIKTPTALVTDLGTEFGVEVEKGGGCEVQVFQGLVEAVSMQDGKPVGPPCRLVQGQVARLVRDDANASTAAGKFVVAEKPADPKRFARKMHVPGRVVCSWQIGTFGQFTVAKDDLINAGQPTLSKIELVSANACFGDSDIHKLNDGEIYAGSERGVSDETFIPYDGSVVVMTLNTALHPSGYDIRSIVSLTGSGGQPGQDRSWQKYNVAYATVVDPNHFVAMRGYQSSTVDSNAHGFEEAQATLRSGSDAPIVSGVAKLRFTFYNTKSIHPESMYREIDVFGGPTAAEDQNALQNTKE